MDSTFDWREDEAGCDAWLPRIGNGRIYMAPEKRSAIGGSRVEL
jgi:hypothetical protein